MNLTNILLAILAALGLFLFKDSLSAWFRTKRAGAEAEKFKKAKEVSDEKAKIARSSAADFLERLRKYRAGK